MKARITLKIMDELYEYGCPFAETGDDYDTVMDSCSKVRAAKDIQRYDTLPLGDLFKLCMKLAPAVVGIESRCYGFWRRSRSRFNRGSVNLELRN